MMQESQQLSNNEIPEEKRGEKVETFRNKCIEALLLSSAFNKGAADLFLSIYIPPRLFKKQPIQFGANQRAYEVSRFIMGSNSDELVIESIQSQGSILRQERISLISHARFARGDFSYACFENGKKVFDGTNTQVALENIENFVETLSEDIKHQG